MYQVRKQNLVQISQTHAGTSADALDSELAAALNALGEYFSSLANQSARPTRSLNSENVASEDSDSRVVPVWCSCLWMSMRARVAAYRPVSGFTMIRKPRSWHEQQAGWQAGRQACRQAHLMVHVSLHIEDDQHSGDWKPKLKNSIERLFCTILHSSSPHDLSPLPLSLRRQPLSLLMKQIPEPQTWGHSTLIPHHPVLHQPKTT